MITSIPISILPVVIFLLFLIFVDSFKLVKFTFILKVLLLGCIVAVVSYGIEYFFKTSVGIKLHTLSIFIAPPLEESLKALIVIILVYAKRIGFLTDAAIVGFAVGAGFSIFENSYYLSILTHESIIIWVLRGFGTAMMHGSTTCVSAIISCYFIERKGKIHIQYFLPGILLAVLFHFVFNLFILPPLLMTLIIIIVFSVVMFIIYEKSEKSLATWLEDSFTSNITLLQAIDSGIFKRTKTGRYLYSIQEILPKEILADMLCYLKIHLELAVRAKALLMMKEAGFKTPPEPEIHDKLFELEYLKRSIGISGMAVLQPLIHKTQKDLWQIYFLQSQE